MTREGQVPFGLIKGSHFQGSRGYNPRAAWEKFILKWSIGLKETFFIFSFFVQSFCVAHVQAGHSQVMLLTEHARGERAATCTCAGDQKYKNTKAKKWKEVWKVTDSLVTKLQSWQQHELKRVNQLWVRQMSEAYAEMGKAWIHIKNKNKKSWTLWHQRCTQEINLSQ